jgi:hypothetical protein
MNAVQSGAVVPIDTRLLGFVETVVILRCQGQFEARATYELNNYSVVAIGGKALALGTIGGRRCSHE